MRSEFQTRSEAVALLALLKAAPRGLTWGDISREVRIVGSAEALMSATREAQGGLFPDPTLDEAEIEAEHLLASWEADGLELVPVTDDRFPGRLAEAFDCPPFLFWRGTLEPDDKGMSVVGSRNASREGLELARLAARMLSKRGLTVIAGLASGIDTAAHEEALRLGARTVAIIGTGIRKYYPASNRVLQDTIANEGLLLSQFYPNQPPTKTTFPMRNGTMSAYGMATIVVEAGEHSGSRIQARKAADHGRPVILSRRVATTTTWGAQLAENAWVSVAESTSDLERQIDSVMESSTEDLVVSLGLEKA